MIKTTEKIKNSISPNRAKDSIFPRAGHEDEQQQHDDKQFERGFPVKIVITSRSA
jgi:hypothetical protein